MSDSICIYQSQSKASLSNPCSLLPVWYPISKEMFFFPTHIDASKRRNYSPIRYCTTTNQNPLLLQYWYQVLVKFSLRWRVLAHGGKMPMVSRHANCWRRKLNSPSPSSELILRAHSQVYDTTIWGSGMGDPQDLSLEGSPCRTCQILMFHRIWAWATRNDVQGGCMSHDMVWSETVQAKAVDPHSIE